MAFDCLASSKELSSNHLLPNKQIIKINLVRSTSSMEYFISWCSISQSKYAWLDITLCLFAILDLIQQNKSFTFTLCTKTITRYLICSERQRKLTKYPTDLWEWRIGIALSDKRDENNVNADSAKWIDLIILWLILPFDGILKTIKSRLKSELGNKIERQNVTTHINKNSFDSDAHMKYSKMLIYLMHTQLWRKIARTM